MSIKFGDFTQLNEKERQEVVNRYKKLYEQYPIVLNALEYAQVLIMLSLFQKKDEIQLTAAKVKALYEEYKTNEISCEIEFVYVNILTNLLSHQDKKENKVTMKEIKNIYEKYKTTKLGSKIAFLFADKLFNLSVINYKDEMPSIVETVKALYEEQKTSNIAIVYLVVLYNLSFNQNIDEMQVTVQDAKKVYEEQKTDSVVNEYIMILNKLLREKDKIEKQLTSEKINEIDENILTNLVPNRIHMGVIYNIISYSKFKKDKLVEKFLDIRLNSSEQEEIELDSIFEKISKNDDRGRIKFELISLLANVMKVKRLSKYKVEKDVNIGHYTKLETLKYILETDNKIYETQKYILDAGDKSEEPKKYILHTENKSKESHLRISNAEHMNDPLEGKTFIQLLKEQCKDGKLDDILEELYQNSNNNCERDRIRFNECNTYLGSFSASIDKLPMWSQYGDDGKGCCLVFNNDFFDEEDNHEFDYKAMSYKKTSEIINPNDEEDKKDKEKYVLYNVVYVGKDEDDKNEKIIQTCKEIANSLIELSKHRKEVKDKQLIIDIDKFVVATLDQIRFLFKDKSYEHEKEKRIIKFSTNPNINKNSIVPQLYIDIEKTVDYKEIILGPKVQKPSEIATYIYNSKKAKNVTRSSIQYR